MLVLVVLALVAMWIYVLFIGKEASPNRLEDQSWAAAGRAGLRRHGGQGRRPALGPLVRRHHSRCRRRCANGPRSARRPPTCVAAQVAALRGAARARPAGTTARSLAAWFADWDTYLGDRADHVADWRAGHDRPFAETEADTGGPISDRMDALATENGMPSCVVPGDFG